MLKSNVTILLTLIAITLHGAEFQKIGKKELFHIKKLFPKAYLQKSYAIDDPITAKGPNKDILLIVTLEGKKLGWVRFIGTDTGCNTACLPLNFSLAFDLKGNFLGHFSMEPLTKKYHRLFKESDLMQLDMILSSDGPGLGSKLVPADLIDGITMATKPDYGKIVVEGAALTTFRMLQYKRQTQHWILLQVL